MDNNNCNPNKPVNCIPLSGGLTNALKFILLVVIKTLEEVCSFYIDESQSQLLLHIGEEAYSLIWQYFEPIGLHPDSIIVQKGI